MKKKEKRQTESEIYFFLGKKNLLDGKTRIAKEYFKKSARLGSGNMALEKILSIKELQAMNNCKGKSTVLQRN
jgi:hypothetical protein